MRRFTLVRRQESGFPLDIAWRKQPIKIRRGSSAMKVTSTQYAMTSAVNQAASTPPARVADADEMKTTRTAAIDPVLGDAQTQLAALPDVDMARVNSMKEAIASGKISVDIDSLAGAIEKYYQR